jgi:hypothetical protein
MRPFPNGRHLYFSRIFQGDCDVGEVGGINGFGEGKPKY